MILAALATLASSTAKTPHKPVPATVLADPTREGLPADAPHSNYTFQMKALYPAAYALWMRSLPEDVVLPPWLKTFNGVTTPVRPIVVDGNAMIFAWACKPHDCGDNHVNILMSADQARVVALVMLAAPGRRLPDGSYERPRSLMLIGQPSPSELTCLRALEGEPDRKSC